MIFTTVSVLFRVVKLKWKIFSLRLRRKRSSWQRNLMTEITDYNRQNGDIQPRRKYRLIDKIISCWHRSNTSIVTLKLLITSLIHSPLSLWTLKTRVSHDRRNDVEVFIHAVKIATVYTEKNLPNCKPMKLIEKAFFIMWKAECDSIMRFHQSKRLLPIIYCKLFLFFFEVLRFNFFINFSALQTQKLETKKFRIACLPRRFNTLLFMT